ncbi:MAG: hypothetical protein JJU46_13355 [Balneolaceae bacterium]|nr:hypothetical protein [Balneolaceae bacterium]MCH8548058.1 hypothetical protein [Balneolaceae bacterium]
MNSLKAIGMGILSFIFATAMFSACESATQADTIDEVMSTVPHLNLIEGAEQAVATVNRERNRTNFKLELDNLSEESPVQPGTYEAFCALWDVAIDSDDGTYGDVKIHAIMDEPYWNTVNYMVNNIDHYYATYEDLTWLDVQIAMWSVMEHKEFNLDTIEHDDLPRDVREGDYSRDLVDALINDARENADKFDPKMANYNIYYGEFSEAQDQIIIERGSEINNLFGMDLYNFANEAEVGITQRFGGNVSSTSVVWNSEGVTPIKIKAEDAGNGRAQFTSVITSGGSNNSSSQATQLPANCSFDGIDRMRVKMNAADEGLKLTLRGTFMGSEQEFTVEEGTSESELDKLITGLDFTAQPEVELELEFEGSDFDSNTNNYVEIRVGCEL